MREFTILAMSMWVFPCMRQLGWVRLHDDLATE